MNGFDGFAAGSAALLDFLERELFGDLPAASGSANLLVDFFGVFFIVLLFG